MPTKGAGATVRTPYPHHMQLPYYQQFDRDHARLRAPRERAFALLRTWHILRRARRSTHRISTIIPTVHALQTCG